MKDGIHPTYYTNVTVSCACGNSFVTGSTAEEIRVEICAACHPFFTGTAKLIDTAGRVDKFRARVEQAKQHQASRPIKKQRTTNQKEPAEQVKSTEEQINA